MRALRYLRSVSAGVLVSAVAVFALIVPAVSGAGIDRRPHMSTKMDWSQTDSQKKLYPVTTGTWGGQSISFTVENDLVRIEFDCADGSIPRQLKADRKGNFKVEGTFTPRSPGPVRRDNQPQPQPALYQGKITGKAATVHVTLLKDNSSAGEFTITRGKTPVLFRCY